MNNKADLLQKAKNYAFLLLKYRGRSEKEIYQRLKKKRFDERLIRETISFLKEKDFINDNYFAKVWIESRLRKPLGIRRIRQELNLKGIAQEIIDRAISEIKNNYSEGNIVKQLLGQRLSRLRGIEPEKAKRRLLAYFIRRGFSPEIVIDTLSTYAVE